MAAPALKTYRLLAATLALWLAALAGARADGDGAGAQQAFAAFFKAFAAADTAAMAKSYADEIVVKRGSTLLQKGYGGLGGVSGTKADKTVKREQLLVAYAEAVENLGGQEDWKRRGDKALRESQVVFVAEESESEVRPGLSGATFFQRFGAAPGDVLAVVRSGGDTAVFQLRKTAGRWVVAGEFWD